jgi:hypothetical protein
MGRSTRLASDKRSASPRQPVLAVAARNSNAEPDSPKLTGYPGRVKQLLPVSLIGPPVRRFPFSKRHDAPGQNMPFRILLLLGQYHPSIAFREHPDRLSGGHLTGLREVEYQKAAG